MGERTEITGETREDRLAAFYGVLCDAVERAWHNWPVERGADEVPVMHTSDYARQAANRVLAALRDMPPRDGDDDEPFEEPRSEAEIQAAEQEMFDRLWYFRTVWNRTPQQIPDVARKPMKRIEDTYKDLVTDDPVAIAFVEGKLSALRWVLGSEWDFLDT